MQKKLLVILSVLVLASLVLAACGSPATPAATEEAATQAPAATEAATEAPTEAATEAAEAKTLKIYLLDYTPDTIHMAEGVKSTPPLKPLTPA